LHLCVADRGPGIPVDELERIFDPFVQSSTTKDGSGGTGLGLPISRRIVEMHGGQLYAANREGGGAEFHLILPATDSATPGDGALAAD
jgi:signal transduction histidine kinase